MFIKTNSNNYIQSISHDLIDNGFNVSDEYESVLLNDLENAHFYKYENGILIFDIDKKTEMETKRNLNMQLGQLRAQRQTECFDVINQNYVIDGQSVTWFDTLTDDQKEEATAWIQAWRDVTDTLIEPDKPSWL